MSINKTKNIRVLQIGKFYPPHFGGMECFLFDMNEELNKIGVRSDVLCANKNKTTVIERMRKYKVIRMGVLGNVAATSLSPLTVSMQNRLKADYDIIHMHHPNPMANLALFLTRPTAKLIVHWHSDIIKQKNVLKLYHPLLLWMLNRADKIIATSERYIGGSKYLSRFDKKIEIIPLGINPSRLQEIDGKVVDILKEKANGKKIVFSLGRLSSYKGFEYLIQSARFLSDDIIIMIGGEGDLKPSLTQLIKKTNMSEKVFLVGEIPERELPAYYCASDLFVLPSIGRNEAFGLVQIEAMHFGKPVVSTDIPFSGVSWVNKDNETGLIVKPKCARALANAITVILNDKDKYRIFSENAKKRAANNFHISEISKKVARVYSDVLCATK